MRFVNRVLPAVLAVVLLTNPALATWSIVVVNKLTREVCTATATCVEGFGLDRTVPVLVVGKGAGAAQAFVFSSAQNRKLIFKGFKRDELPLRILDHIAKSDNGLGNRQFGIVSFLGDPVTFTGSNLTPFNIFAWAGGLAGETDELIYAIQGNSLTGQPVVDAAEFALLNTPGDLGQKVMAAMEAARSMGGDGRCSCMPSDADGCGSPPPNFTKAAHQAVIVLARPDDTNGVCDGNSGCVNGDYYLFLTEGGLAADSDPVIRLQQSYDTWRAGLAAVPDHYQSRVNAATQALVADGLSSTTVTVELVDVDGVPLTSGGALLSIKKIAPTGKPTAKAGAVTDHGDGRYSFELVATMLPGRGAWEITVDSGSAKTVRLQPPLIVSTDPLTELHAGVYDLHVGQTGPVPFTLNRGAADAGRSYHLLGSYSGTSPGIDLGTLILPLNRDRFFEYTWFTPGGTSFAGSAGTLDADGRAQALLSLPDAAWASVVGRRFDFCTLLGGPNPEVTNVVGFFILP